MLDDKGSKPEQNGDMNGPSSLSNNGNDYIELMNDKITKKNLVVKTNSIPDVHLQIDDESDSKFQFETGV